MSKPAVVWALCESPYLHARDGYGIPCLVGVAATAAEAERWRAEPAEGVKREIGAVTLIGGSVPGNKVRIYSEGEITDAVDAACECGGGEPGRCCAACDVRHWLHGHPAEVSP